MDSDIANQELCCIRCRSKNVRVENKGYSLGKGVVGGTLLGPLGLLAGLYGHKKIKFMCLNCGKEWNFKRHLEHLAEERRRARMTPEEKENEDNFISRIGCAIIVVIILAFIFWR